jgi:hypothetical protein
MNRAPKSQLFVLLFLSALAAGRVVAAFDQEQSPEKWRFGVIESQEAPDKATELGVAWTRLSFHWAAVQSGGPDSWTPAVSDEQLEAELAAGRTVVGLLIGMPDWARDAADLPQGLYLPPDDPANSWANFVRQAVSRYRGRIDHWIVWNEPDIPETEIAHTWDGSVADFAQLQRSAYLAAKEANPNAVVHLSAFTYWADYYAGTEQYMARLLDEIKADPEAARHNHYFDVATAHLYFQPSQIYDLLGLFSDIMRERGLEQPIWLVETNAPPKDDPAWTVADWTLSVTQHEQAAFVPQAMAAALAAGAERIAIYKLKDTEEDRAANPEPFGLLRLDGSQRPAYTGYKIAMRYLGGATRAERERWNEIGQFRLDQSGQTTTVLFARLPAWQRAKVTATDDTAVLVDMWGSSEVITATNSIFTVDLPPARCSQSIGDYCMIGGLTYYLVQSADTQPPTPTRTPTATASASATATGTPTALPTATATDAAATIQPAAVATTVLTSTPSPATATQPAVAAEIKPGATPAASQPPADRSDVLMVCLFGGLLLLALLLLAAIIVRSRSSD